MFLELVVQNITLKEWTSVCGQVAGMHSFTSGRRKCMQWWWLKRRNCKSSGHHSILGVDVLYTQEPGLVVLKSRGLFPLGPHSLHVGKARTKNQFFLATIHLLHICPPWINFHVRRAIRAEHKNQVSSFGLEPGSDTLGPYLKWVRDWFRNLGTTCNRVWSRVLKTWNRNWTCYRIIRSNQFFLNV